MNPTNQILALCIRWSLAVSAREYSTARYYESLLHAAVQEWIKEQGDEKAA